MIRLRDVWPLGGLDEVHGDLRLTEWVPGRLTWLAPFPGEEEAMSRALRLAHGVPFPAPGETAENGATRVLWAGRSQALLAGAAPAAELARCGAVVDQSDAWAGLRLTGAGAAEVLARLCPLDLRPGSFPPGRTARSLLGHMTAQITAAAGSYEVLVMRSMAATAAQETLEAMRGVAARRA